MIWKLLDNSESLRSRKKNVIILKLLEDVRVDVEIFVGDSKLLVDEEETLKALGNLETRFNGRNKPESIKSFKSISHYQLPAKLRTPSGI